MEGFPQSLWEKNALQSENKLQLILSISGCEITDEFSVSSPCFVCDGLFLLPPHLCTAEEKSHG